LDLAFHLNNVNRVWVHLKGEVPEQIRVRFRDVPAIMERCRGCHQQEFAQWKSGPHATPYSAIFVDEKHNKKRLLMDDCLRCHGMHFDGSINDLVTPVSTQGPWKLRKPELADRPVIPCLTCHEMHHKGDEMGLKYRRTERTGVQQETIRPSLALLDRRAQQHIDLSGMAIPLMREGQRLVKMSPDRRQALCYQCHAPLSSAQAGSGDDRTPMGVHEGLSCLACHQKHAQLTRASCSTCHPRLSNCGLDVEKMDTTFANLKSKHDIHWVKCIDCHPKGVPVKKKVEVRATAALR
jgi:RNase P subunit RPR2